MRQTVVRSSRCGLFVLEFVSCFIDHKSRECAGLTTHKQCGLVAASKDCLSHGQRSLLSHLIAVPLDRCRHVLQLPLLRW